MKPLSLVLACCATTIASAHPGHGPTEPHWHATDLVGFAWLALVVVVVGAWWGKRK